MKSGLTLAWALALAPAPAPADAGSPAVPLAPAKSRGVPTSIYIMIGIVAVLAGALIYVVILNRS